MGNGESSLSTVQALFRSAMLKRTELTESSKFKEELSVCKRDWLIFWKVYKVLFPKIKNIFL